MNDEKSINVVTIDGSNYIVENLSNEQKIFLEHVFNVDAKLKDAMFHVDQLTVCKDAFIAKFKECSDVEK